MPDVDGWREYRRWAWDFVKQAGVPLRAEEQDQIEVTDFGLGEIERTGLQILTLGSDAWLGAKLLILRPFQFCPQHRHPPNPSEGYPGKTELFRCQFGKAFLYVPGLATEAPQVAPPAHRRRYCTVWHEIVLAPGSQHISPPNTWHWFQAGSTGAVVWSISSKVTDSADEFSDPEVVR